MKMTFRFYSMLVVTLLAFASCKKDAVVAEDDSSLEAYNIAVAKSPVTGDSIYVVNACDRQSKLKPFDFNSLPANVSSYLSANYSGYTSFKAFVIANRGGNVSGYVAIINYHGKPVGLKFDASGNFEKVLEQREGRDHRNGRGWHPGGHFDHRDGRNRDTIALSALPTNITSYLASNHGQDTLIRAFKNRDSSIVVISANNGLYATVFDKNGNFIKRFQLPSRPGRPTPIDPATLPASIPVYLSATYPGYVIKHAFKINAPGNSNGYVVLIDSNNTKYAVQFDAAGNFIKAVTIR